MRGYGVVDAERKALVDSLVGAIMSSGPAARAVIERTVAVQFAAHQVVRAATGDPDRLREAVDQLAGALEL